MRYYETYMNFYISNTTFIIMIIQVAKRDTVLGGKAQGPQHHFVFLPEVVSSDTKLLDIVPAAVSRIFNIQRYTIIVHHNSTSYTFSIRIL